MQGVFFRDTCRRIALDCRVAGWVRNRRDGTVEAVFEGDAAAVGRMVQWARNGPRDAIVDKLDVYDEPPEGLSGFAIRG